MKILIVGYGAIGKSHVKSFLISKRKYTLDIIDNRSNFLLEQQDIPKKKNIKINFKNKYPINKNYDLLIIATSAEERLKVFKKIVNKNSIKYLILEKFLFNKEGHYKEFEKIIKKKNIKKIRVNSWGYQIYLEIKNYVKLDRNSLITVNIKEGELLSNLLHFLDLFCCYSGLSFDLKTKIKKIIKSKRKPYNEIIGNIIAKNSNSKINICTKRNIIFPKVYIKSRNKFFFLDFNEDGNCRLYKNKKILNKFPFPFAWKTTEKNFFKYFIKNNDDSIADNYTYIAHISKKILETLKSINKNILIT